MNTRWKSNVANAIQNIEKSYFPKTTKGERREGPHWTQNENQMVPMLFKISKKVTSLKPQKRERGGAILKLG